MEIKLLLPLLNPNYLKTLNIYIYKEKGRGEVIYIPLVRIWAVFSKFFSMGLIWMKTRLSYFLKAVFLLFGLRLSF